MTQSLRIDTHHHYMPPFYRAWLAEQGIHAAGGRRLPDWSPEVALGFMADCQVESSVLSISTPGVHLGDTAAACAMARRVNDYGAEVVAQWPGRFGFFATLPLPDVSGAVAEACRALDTLNADGVMMLANAAGIYLGDPAWDPLMAELNERDAVVFVHPSDLPGPATGPAGIPGFVADFMLDTTRAALQYAQSGGFERFPRVKVILSHAGGFVPYAAERMARICSPDGKNPGGIARLQQFYFDTALSSSPYALPALLAFVGPERITFGSDWPFADAERSLHFAGLLDQYPLDAGARRAIHRGTAEALFPRLAQTASRG